MGREGNRFKWESFSKKIEKVGGQRALIRKELGDTKHDETHFAEALEKWVEIDRGADFYAFLKAIPHKRDLTTYAQVLHYSKQIFGALLEALEVPETSALMTLLEMCIALAKDLRDEFYQHMWPLFERIIYVMERADNNVELLDKTHLTMALLFKQHWRLIIKELRKTFDRFCPLFGSQHKYVRRFAAEAFAFLMRKSSAIPKFTVFMFEKAQKVQDDRLLDGVAMLIFNAIRGVNGQFYSGTEELLAEMLNATFAIQDPEGRKTGFDAFQSAIIYCIHYAKREHFAPVVRPLFNLLSKTTDPTSFCQALKLINAATVRVKNNRVFSQESELLAIIEQAVPQAWFVVDEVFLDLLAQLVNEVYDSEKWFSKLRDLFAAISSRTDSDPTLLKFLESIHKIQCFDLYIMPALGSLATRVVKSDDESAKAELLRVYAEICLDRRPLEGAIDRAGRATFFDTSYQVAVREYVNEQVASANKWITDTEWSEVALLKVAHALAVWPWLTPADEVMQGSASILALLLSLLSAPTPQDRATVFLQSQLVFFAASALFQADKTLLRKVDEKLAFDFIRNFGCTDSALRFYRLFVTVKKPKKSLEDLDQIIVPLTDAFASPYLPLRLCALDICARFDVPLEGQSENAFAVLASAERESLDHVGLREKLRKFRSLVHGKHTAFLPKGRAADYEAIILRVCLAQFHQQYIPLWKGMHEIILSYASGLQLDAFWAEVDRVLMTAFAGLRNDIPLSIPTALSSLIPEVDSSSRTDFSSFIEQMLLFLAKAPEVSERKTKILVPLFLDFFSKDYLNAEKPSLAEEITPTEPEAAEAEPKEGNEELADWEVVPDPEAEQEEETALHILSKRMARRVLIAFLQMFSSFRGPKSIHRNQEVFAVYNELLLSWDPELQKAALNCIFAYKFKWMNSYKENLLALLDKKAFRGELLKLNVGSENSVIAPGHVDELLPVILRVLYGRLVAPAAKMGHNHRTHIIRFIAGCSADQLNQFIRLLFHAITKNFDISGSSYESLTERVKTDAALREKIDMKSVYM
ncbi:unnamed protein product, partial [Mesorhabditis spiculigera]